MENYLLVMQTFVYYNYYWTLSEANKSIRFNSLQPKNLIYLKLFLYLMSKKRLLVMSMVLLLLIIPLVAAEVTDTLKNVWEKIISVGNLSALGLSNDSVVLGLTRILIGILIFTIFFGVMTGLKQSVAPFKFFSRGQAGVVAAVIAIIAAIFLPNAVLGATGVGWATAVALFLIGGPIVGLGYLAITFPGRGNETKGTVFIKLILCLLLFWILSAMRTHISSIGI